MVWVWVCRCVLPVCGVVCLVVVLSGCEWLQCCVVDLC